jgi:hypothetical protein
MASDSGVSKSDRERDQAKRKSLDPKEEAVESARDAAQAGENGKSRPNPQASDPDRETADPKPGLSPPAPGGPPPAEPDGESARKSHWAFDARGRFLLFAAVPSWLVSMILHALLLMMLALLSFPEQSTSDQIVALTSTRAEVEEIDEIEDEEIEPVDVQAFMDEAPVDLADVEAPEDTITIPEFEDIDAAPQHFDLQEIADFKAPDNDMASLVGAMTGNALQGRGAEARKSMVKRFGGSEGSEAAVASALTWISEHQERDGGWSFNHQRACGGRCGNPGVIGESRRGATAIALLPFLGAGQTHKDGKYKKTVEQGLAFLIRNMKVQGVMGDLSDPGGGSLYSHGLAAIALCEAYAMTNDSELLQPAQMALNFTIFAQDPLGGGWRYKPHQPGDTSALGWQLMALKSGHMAYLKVPPETIRAASGFLDYVAVDNGAKYGYTMPAPRPSTTAVGLLCRMYLGWKKDQPALKAGVEFLSRTGPTDNIYQDYYTTQVMRHYGGEFWEKWNGVMRDKMVNSQVTKGHARGSWFFPKSPHADSGGRLYCTAMATMILEVYYRHLPIYGRQAAEEDFPL